MRFWDLFKLSTRMFKARTSRTILTILGMGVGIAAILFLVSLGYGLQKTLLEKITTSDSLLTLDVTESSSDSVSLNEETAVKIGEIDGVEEISRSFSLNSQGQVDDLTADLIATAVQPSFLRLGGYKLEEGTLLNEDNKTGVVVSSPITQLFKKEGESIVGKKIRFSFSAPADGSKNKNSIQESSKKIVSNKDYEIIGVVQNDDNVVYIHKDSLDEIGVKNYDELKVKCVSNDKMNSVREEIINQGLLVSSLSDTIDQANKIFEVIKIVLMGFGIIALIVSAIGMFNTMTIALLERTNELGIMKSIGASNSSVSMMFVIESAVMGFLGGLVGILLGFLEGKIFNFLVNLIAARMGGQSVDLFYSPSWFVGLIIIFAGLVGIATGLVPARRASKIDPLSALRYK